MPDHTKSPRAQEVLDGAEAAYRAYHKSVTADPDYPALHLAPPVGRLNDPNGLVYKDGVYHAFYQYAPTHPARDIFWRHAQSRDLLHWEEERNAIEPIYWYDRNGCYSGSSFIADDGTLEFFYTGNVKNPDGSRETYQCLVTSADNCQTFQRFEENPLVSGTPDGYTAHFRDPYVYERQGRYYAMLGAQRKDRTGAVALYSSANRREWEFEGEIDFSDPAINSYGYMLECPQVLRMRDRQSGQMKDLMIFCPQGMEAQGELYNNKYQAGYIVGQLKGLHFEVETPFTEFDAGFEFYAPQFFHNSNDGDRVLISAWFGISDQDEMPSWDRHWLHMLTLPRWIYLSGGKVWQQPVEGLDAVLPPAATELSPEGEVLPVRDSRVFRVTGEVDVSRGPVQLVIGDEAGDAAFVLEFSAQQIRANRAGTKYTVWGPERRRTGQEPKARRRFDLLVDASALEAFVDGGELTVSGRSYFHGRARRVRVLADGRPAPQRLIRLAAASLAE